MRAVVSTNALELGIDIGALDVSVMAGYPGTIAATWQRAGRAGRRSTRSAAVLVASSAPIDQFIVRNPSYFFDASPEHALINPDNLHILLDHVKCAAFELPVRGRRAVRRARMCRQVLSVLAEQGFVHHADGQWNWTNESYPADAVSLRSVSSDNFIVVDITHGERVIGETDFTSGPSTLHEKAIYILEGQLFQVEKLDFDGRKAYLRSVECDYYTDAITYTKVTILDTFETRHRVGIRAARCSDATLSRAGSREPTARDAEQEPRRSPRRLARRRFQEDQVLHQREHRFRRARSARTADAHDVVLADDPVGDDAGAAVWRRRSARRRRRAGVRDEERRAAAADVRRPRHRAVGGRRVARSLDADVAASAAFRRRSPPSRTSSSTTTIRAGSASAVRCSRCTTCCSSARRS